MFESIPDALIYCDHHKKIQLVNSAALSLFGYDHNELIGKSSDIVYADKKEKGKPDLHNKNIKKDNTNIISNGSEEHTSELQSRGLISYAVFCLKKKKKNIN